MKACDIQTNGRNTVKKNHIDFSFFFLVVDVDVNSWQRVLKSFSEEGEGAGDSVPPASLLLCQHTSAAEEMGH